MINRRLILLEFTKWAITAFISILISGYLFTQLAITNNLLIILLTAGVISVLIQAVRSHEGEFSFRMRWFLFYFLVYAIIILVLEDYIFPKLGISNFLLSSFIMGIIISGVIILIQEMKIRSRTIPWISIVIILIFVVANINSLQSLLQEGLRTNYENASVKPESEQTCPTPIVLGSSALPSDFSSKGYMDRMFKTLTNQSVWNIENKFSPCYLGKYKGQYPNWMYCDDLIVSRWETGSSGTINYRWYTAVTAGWKPQDIGSNAYTFAGFSCENGQKVTIAKGTTNYYVYDSRNGNRINIPY